AFVFVSFLISYSNIFQIPQWASWALKSLSGKFYKFSPSVQNQAESAHKQGSSVCESTSTTKSSSELKSSTKLPDDGWGELDSSSIENEEKWEDANEALTTDTTNTSKGWDNEYGEVKITTAENKTSATTMSGARGKSSGIGRLKLQHTVTKPTVDDDLDQLLGIKPKSNAIDRLSHSKATNRSIFSVKNTNNTLTDGWDDSSITSGWDDFDVSSDAISAQAVESEGWDMSWDADEHLESKSKFSYFEVNSFKFSFL
ncbi:unnamed protein product, partial [Onchocerca flexuosa]|uniref:ADP-ribosylation factor GTPase-activating protein 1 n=1 Tax=Onchocerca flexuosa TaxID=387005 RepID=A0A183HP20_9BILA